MYRLSTIDRLFVVRWEETTLGDLNELSDTVRRYHADRGERLLYVSVSDERTKNPSPQVQRGLVGFVDDHRAQLERVYIVITTRGFAAAAQRAVLSSMMLISGRRGAVDVHGSFESMLSAVVPHLGVGRAQVEEALRRDDIMSRATGT